MHPQKIQSLFGYDQGVTGGLLDLPSFNKYFPSIDPLDPLIKNDPVAQSQRSSNQGITVAAYNLGCFLGAILTIFIGNPLGRRRTIFTGCIIMSIGALLQCTSYHLPHLIVGRIVTGIGNGINTSTVPTWQSETAKSHDRGKLIMIEGALITGGITFSYWVNYGGLKLFIFFSNKTHTLMIAEQVLHGLEKMRWHGGFPWPFRFLLR